MISIKFYKNEEEAVYGAMVGKDGATWGLFNYKDDQELRAGLDSFIQIINQHPDEEVHLFDAEMTDFPNENCFYMVVTFCQRFLPLEESVRQMNPCSWLEAEEDNSVVEANW